MVARKFMDVMKQHMDAESVQVVARKQHTVARKQVVVLIQEEGHQKPQIHKEQHFLFR